VTRLSWGILGLGGIAHAFAKGLLASEHGRLAAVGSRAQATADTFGAQYDAPRRHGSYEALLADETVEAIYIATPHPSHAEWALKAAAAGKHLLVEKPIGLNHAEAMAMVEAARRHDVFLMEAFMYRCHPQTIRLAELIRSGAIGAVRALQVNFSFDSGRNLEHRLLNQRLGGGGILDVGGYPVSFARMVAGAAAGRLFADPLAVQGAGQIGAASRVDEWAMAQLSFADGLIAQVACGVQLRMERGARIYGSEGSIHVPEPFVPGRGGPARLVVQRYDAAEPETIELEPGNLYALEADAVAAALGERQSPAMSWDDTLGNMAVLDTWRGAIGMVYDSERPDAPEQRRTLSGRPLAVSAEAAMPYGRIAGVEKPVSRLVMGCDNQVTMPHAAVMFDDFFERGGTVFDTAYIYASGACERILGQWIKNRGVREQIVLLDKGAHTPHCTPEAMRAQLTESLGRLQTDYVDIYMLHRDNPAIPAGAFIEALNAELRAGRLRAFGASNWSIERVAEANRYAEERGLVGFAAMSNNFSLARMVEPVWAGCIAASDPASRAWLSERQLPLMPWSSQARGFFTGRAHPDRHDDPELVRCWYSPDNFVRLERVNALAAKLGAPPIAVALAYVLAQPFPTFPLIGPRTLAETRTSFEALAVALAPEDVRWLNLESDQPPAALR
jgi:predicted dehydrogenase/aryl-alcohol dehydrogenase-like predicted oxidoreductase